MRSRFTVPLASVKAKRESVERNEEALLAKVERMEQAAKHGIENCQNRDPSIPAEKMISVEQCELILKNCAMFRQWINEYLGS